MPPTGIIFFRKWREWRKWRKDLFKTLRWLVSEIYSFGLFTWQETKKGVTLLFQCISNSNSPSLIVSVGTNVRWHGLSHHLAAIWHSAASVKLKLMKIMLRACHNPETAVMFVINSCHLNKDTNLHVRELLCLVIVLILASSPAFSLRSVSLPMARLRLLLGLVQTQLPLLLKYIFCFQIC